eukprot:g4606.t1
MVCNNVTKRVRDAMKTSQQYEGPPAQASGQASPILAVKENPVCFADAVIDAFAQESGGVLSLPSDDMTFHPVTGMRVVHPVADWLTPIRMEILLDLFPASLGTVTTYNAARGQEVMIHDLRGGKSSVPHQLVTVRDILRLVVEEEYRKHSTRNAAALVFNGLSLLQKESWLAFSDRLVRYYRASTVDPAMPQASEDTLFWSQISAEQLALIQEKMIRICISSDVDRSTKDAHLEVNRDKYEPELERMPIIKHELGLPHMRQRGTFCIAKKQPECHYSVRRITGPRPDSASRRPSKSLPGKTARATAPSSGSWDDGGGSGSGGLVSERHFSSKLALKRARLGPSPATGLIGLRENGYIAEFFRTMGFLPFTNESFIRKALVKNMFRAVQEHDYGVQGCSASAGFGGEDKTEEEEEEEEEEGGRRDGTGAPRTGPGDEIESTAGACVLWSTVAVGCLIGGRPKSSVDGYARLAREALSDCFDDMSVQTARAFTAMALLQNFLGNEEKFGKYIDFARSIMRAFPSEDIPTDLADAHMFVKACDLFDGFYHQLGEEDLKDAMGALSGDSEAVNLVKKPRPIPQAELCRWLLKTDIRLSACFSMDMQNNGFFGDLRKAGARTPCSQPRPDSGEGPASGYHDDGGQGVPSSNPPHGGYSDVPGAEAELNEPAPRICWLRQLSGTAEPPPPGPISQKFAARVLPDMNLMMHVTQSPEVRGGVGEVYLRMIMAYVCLLQERPNNAVCGLLRCADVLVKKPGICRFTSWKHVAHCCLAGMASSNLAGPYEELRTSYNSVINDGRQAPPFEEFRGMSCICENVLCKSVYNFFIAHTASKEEPSNLFDGGAAVPSEEEAKLRTPETECQDVGIAFCSSTASDEPPARGLFETRRQPADNGSETGSESSSPAAATAEVPAALAAALVAVAPAELGAAAAVVGAFGGSTETEQQGTGARFGFGVGTEVEGSVTGSSFSSTIRSSSSSTRSSITSSISSNGVGPVTAGDMAAVTAGQDGNFSRDKQGAAPDPAGMDGNYNNGGGGLEMLHTSELESAEVAGILDAVDELLGEGGLEGFGKAGSEERVPSSVGSTP